MALTTGAIGSHFSSLRPSGVTWITVTRRSTVERLRRKYDLRTSTAIVWLAVPFVVL